jgi:hypothetical protein
MSLPSAPIFEYEARSSALGLESNAALLAVPRLVVAQPDKDDRALMPSYLNAPAGSRLS